MKLISLIGEQPIPPLLINRYLKPEQHLLAHTELTRIKAENLQSILKNVKLIALKPYNFSDTYEILLNKGSRDTIYDVTAGTKIMAFAAYDAAKAHWADFVYLQSQGKVSRLYQYKYRRDEPEKIDLPPLININSYLRVHGLKTVEEKPLQNKQEVAINYFLKNAVDEIKHNLQYPAFEIDFVVRRGNNVAVIEAKDTMENTRKGLDQLTTIAAREYLGTYTGRILITKKEMGAQLQDLAQAHGMRLLSIKLVNHSGHWRLDEPSKAALHKVLDEVLGAQIK